MDSLRLEPKAKFVGHLNCITKLEQKCTNSQIFEGKKPNWIGTMVRVNERGTELGTIAIAEFGTTVALYTDGNNQGIIELFMNELSGCDRIIVFEEFARDLIKKHNHKNIEVILEYFG